MLQSRTTYSFGLWLPIWLIFAAFFENMAQQPLISVFSVNLGATAALAGLTVGIYSLFNIGGNLLSGLALARWGPRISLGGGMLAVGLIVIAYGMSQTPGQFLLLRCLHGLAGGLLVPIIFVYLSSFTQGRRHGRTMATGGIAVALASTIGPVLSGLTNQRWGFSAAFAGIGGVLLFSGLLALLRAPQKLSTSREIERATWRMLLKAWQSAPVRGACLIAFAFMAGMGIMAFRLPLRAQELGLLSGQVGMAFGAFSLTAGLMMWPAGHLSDRWGRKPLLLTGLVIASTGLAGLGLGQTYVALLGAIVTFGAGFGILFPVSNALLLDGSPSGQRATSFGLFHGFFSLGVFSGPLLAVWLLGYLSPFYVAATIMLLVALLSAWQLVNEAFAP